jgi:uncharacterized protein (TIGR00255 family)
MSAARAAQPVQSMTGFSSVEGEVAGARLRLEMKTLNHRFMDVKLRLPRELSALDVQLRAALQAKFSRGSFDVKLERVASADEGAPVVHTNLGLAASYYEALTRIQKTLGLSDPIRTIDVAHLPEVISRTSAEAPSEDLWAALEPLLGDGIDRLTEMRRHEGEALSRVLLDTIDELESTLRGLRARRAECQESYRERVGAKVRAVFEAHPLPDSAAGATAALLESRIAQELALLMDRTDVEEELTRFQGHLDHFRKVLRGGGAVGRKLDFILQELHREINTLGNKAQDFAIGEEVVQVKVRLEQVREQVMNLE